MFSEDDLCAECGLIGDPQGICVDDFNNILVADRTSGAIFLYNEQGQFLRSLLSSWGSIHEPRQLRVFNNRSLVVLNGFNILKVFYFK